MGFARFLRRGVREAEGARLESACAVTPYRGFESHPLRLIILRATAPSGAVDLPRSPVTSSPTKWREDS